MRSIRWLAILIPLLLFSQPSALHYAAPYGTGGYCDADNPCSLATALNGGGDIWLLPGTYKGTWLINQPNTHLRSVPGTRAILDGDVQVWGDGSTLQDLEITYTDWTSRASIYAGSQPADIPSQKGLTILAAHTKILRCVIHDTPGGIGWWQTATDSEMRGNLIYNAGWKGTDRGHGPGVYAQNRADGPKLLIDNVIGPSYSLTGLQFYGTSAAPLVRFHAEHNVLIGTRFLIGGGSPVDDVHAVGNLLWKAALEVGWTYPKSGTAEIRDNYIALQRMSPHGLQNLTMTGNTVINRDGVDLMQMYLPTSVYTYTIDNNTYLSNRTQVFWNGISTIQTFPQWQASGYDAGGTFGPLPTQNKIFVRATGAHRGYVVVYNWGNLPIVAPDLSALNLTPGASYKLVNAQNPAEVQSFVSGTPITIAMSGWTVAAPIAGAGPLATFDPRFAVFLVTP